MEDEIDIGLELERLQDARAKALAQAASTREEIAGLPDDSLRAFVLALEHEARIALSRYTTDVLLLSGLGGDLSEHGMGTPPAPQPEGRYAVTPTEDGGVELVPPPRRGPQPDPNRPPGRPDART